jgi:hypothetical protein
VAIMPQILVIYKTNEVENKRMQCILIFQSAYRIFYIFNWIVRLHEGYQDPISWAGGLIQAILCAVAFQRLLSKQEAQSNVLRKSHSHLVFFLRFIQLGATVINGFIWSYLAWSHNHYCAWYPLGCTNEQLRWAQVPWQYILMIATVRRLLTICNSC